MKIHFMSKMIGCLFMLTLLVIWTGPESDATPIKTGKAVEIKEGWQYTLAKVLPEQAGSVTWTPIDNPGNVPQPVETGTDAAVTYRLTLPDLDCNSCSLSFRHYTRIFELYWNGQLIYRSPGNTDFQNVKSVRPPLLIHLPDPQQSNELLIVTNHYHRSQLIRFPVFFGESENVLQNIWKADRLYVSISIFIIMMGLLSFMLYLSLSKDVLFLTFGLTALHIGSYLFANSNIILHLLPDPEFWEYFEYISLYTLPITGWFYFRSFLTHRPWMDALILYPNIAFALFALFSAANGDPIYNWADEQRYLFLFFLLFSLGLMIRSAKSGNRDARNVLLTFGLVTFVTTLNIVIKIIYPNPFELNTYSGAFFMMSQLFLLTYRFKRMNQELAVRTGDLQKMNSKLREMNEIKDSIISNTSHELRTPLNGIIGMTEALMEAPDMSRKELNHNLLAIAQSGIRLQSLVNNILDFSHIREHKLVLNLRMVNIEAIVMDVVGEILPDIGSKPVSIAFQPSGKVKLINADPNRMKQIIFHILDNAIKFTEQGTITVDTVDHANSISIRISDPGIGIDKELMSRMFNLFEQGDMSTNRKYSGTGLGLALVKELTELHEGTITCESEPGNGTTMTLTFPSAQ